MALVCRSHVLVSTKRPCHFAHFLKEPEPASVAQSAVRQTGDQKVAGLISTGSDNILSWNLIMNICTVILSFR